MVLTFGWQYTLIEIQASNKYLSHCVTLQNLIMLPQHTRVVQACSTQTNIVVNEQFSSYQINLSSLKEPRHSEDLCLPHTLTL